ncbi:glycoside hydrolase family 11 protein [Rugosimonospora africana]|nr:glycoside hydrolase family 11 protein [Rugosimonospora africana]
MNDAPVRSRSRRRTRIRLLIGGACAAALAAAILPGIANAATQICSPQTGTNGGNYYSFWNNGQGSSCITLNSGTNYSSTWSSIGDWVGGVGWNPGSTSRTISYTGSLNGSGGTALMTLYGWSTNPLVEYYVIDNWIGSPNTAGTNMGTMTSDGGTYTIIKHQQVNQPSIQGTATFWQYLAIRTSKRTGGGTITFSNFVNAWASHGMNLGTMNYQIMATEAWGGGSGSSSVSIGGSPPPTTTPPTTTPPTTAPPTSPPPTGGGGSGCRATYSVANSWQGGFNASVTVTNAGSSTLNGWTVHLTLPSGQSIASLWNGVNSGTSGAVTVKNAAYNGTLGAGASTSFGYTGSGDGSQTPSNISCTSP